MSTMQDSQMDCLVVFWEESSSGKLTLIVNLPRIFKARMDELGIDFAELVRRYCAVRIKRGEVGIKPNNQRRTIKRIFDGEGSTTIETFVDIISALEGEVNINWRIEKEVVRVEVQERAEKISNDTE